ncbi:MAG: Deoxycytidylate deaminase [Clostridia bacterium]|jgi:dCMP deaminase|nr:Deoxycytidylate deaminase [Clostridia bacterium]
MLKEWIIGTQLKIFYYKKGDEYIMGKRNDYISWDEYFMGIAKLSEERSKDPTRQVGACIVNKENRILSIGYNGLPNGISDDKISWEKIGSPMDTKYFYVCHAELNAILNNRNNNLVGSILYVSLFPCNECAKAIIQSGIGKVVYYNDKHADKDSTKASKIMLDMAGVEYVPYIKKNKKIEIEL